MALLRHGEAQERWPPSTWKRTLAHLRAKPCAEGLILESEFELARKIAFIFAPAAHGRGSPEDNVTQESPRSWASWSSMPPTADR
jgi:hypothetical protein